MPPIIHMKLRVRLLITYHEQLGAPDQRQSPAWPRRRAPGAPVRLRVGAVAVRVDALGVCGRLLINSLTLNFICMTPWVCAVGY